MVDNAAVIFSHQFDFEMGCRAGANVPLPRVLFAGVFAAVATLFFHFASSNLLNYLTSLLSIHRSYLL